jgi:hypothetical protein
VNSEKTITIGALLVFYAIAFIVFTYPLILDFGSCFISDSKDGCVFPWNIYNFRDNLLHSKNPFFTDKIFYPVGSSLVLHVYAPVSGVVGLLFSNPVFALNLTVLLSFIFSGLGAYMLCNSYVENRLLSALAGFVYAYCPYKLLHLYGHYDLMLSATIPFFILFFVKSFTWDCGEKHRRFAKPRIVNQRSLGLAIVFFVITFFSCYYYTYYLIIFVMLYLFYYGRRLHDVNLFTRNKSVYALLIIVASTLAVGALHFLTGLDRTGPTRIGLGSSTDLVAFFVPSAHSRFLASDAVKYLRLNVIRTNQVESTVYVGYAILVFALAYFITHQPRRETPRTKMLSFMTAAYLVFATPIVLVADRIMCAFPTALIHYMPFVKNFRVPYRFNIMLMLFLPMLGCLFLKRYVLPRFPKSLRFILVSALVFLLFIEYMPTPYPMVCRRDVPRVYTHLAAKEDGVLLEIPFGLRDGFRMIGDERTSQMYYQTIHHKKILGGLVSRPSKHIFEYFQSQPVVSDILRMEEDQSWKPAAYGEAQVVDFLETFAVRYIIIYPEYRGSSLEKYLETTFSQHIVGSVDIDRFALSTLGPPRAQRATQ